MRPTAVVVLGAAFVLGSCGHHPTAAVTAFRGEAEGREALLRDLGQTPSFEDAAAIAARYAAACGDGWHPACAPSWSGEGLDRLASAATVLGPACDAGDALACDVVAWSLLDVEPGVPSARAAGVARGAGLLRQTCGTPAAPIHPGVAQACLDLAALEDDGIGVAKDPPTAVETIRAVCSAGDPRACAEQAVRMASGDGLPKDPVAAAAANAQACDAGVIDACSELAVAMSQGNGVTVDPPGGAAKQQAACDAGSPLACTRIGRARLVGDNVARDPGAAATLFERSCNAGEPTACAALSAAYSRGDGVQKDGRRAVRYALLACRAGGDCGQGDAVEAARLGETLAGCDGGDQVQCTSAGTALSEARRPLSEREVGIALLKDACTSGRPDACATMGARHEEGLSVPRDLRIAAEFHDKACNGGILASCSRAGALYASGEGPEKSREKAAAAYAKVCGSGDAAGCRNQAEQLLQGGIEGALSNGASQGRDLFQTRCDGGDGLACQRVGDIWSEGLGVRPDSRKAMGALGRACLQGVDQPCWDLSDYALGNMGKAAGDIAVAAGGVTGGLGARCETAADPALKDRSCATLARLLTRGKGVPHDAAGAAARATAGCDAGGMASCGELGRMLVAGQGVPKDAPRGLELLGKACDAKIAEACLDLDKANGKAPTTAPRDPRQDAVIYH
jgi:TPR repeat protein